MWASKVPKPAHGSLKCQKTVPVSFCLHLFLEMKECNLNNKKRMQLFSYISNTKHHRGCPQHIKASTMGRKDRSFQEGHNHIRPFKRLNGPHESYLSWLIVGGASIIILSIFHLGPIRCGPNFSLNLAIFLLYLL